MQLCSVAFISAPLTPLFTKRRRNPMSPSSQLAERLLAHARLCRQIARRTWNEQTATELEKLADECDLTAERVPATDQSGTLH